MPELPEPLPVWGGWATDVQDDPFPHFAEHRARCPVHQVRLGGETGPEAWLVVGHDAARQALMDPRFSKDMLAALDTDPDVVDEGLPGPAFAPSRVAALEPAIGRIADELLDELERSGPVVDLVAGFALPFSFQVIGELLGVPRADQPALHQAFRTLLRPWSGSPPPEAVAASDAIVAYLEHLVATHRAEPADDLVGVLVTASDDGGRLTRQELLSSLFQLVVAGHDTTTSLIGNGVVALLDHPEQLDLLRSEPDHIAAAVEEVIRFDAPVPHATFRVTTELVELDGVEIPAHQQVLVSIGAANRDPGAHDDPDRFDVTRPPQRHLGFGQGIHFCLGAPLARLEGRVAFTALLQRFPQLGLAVPRTELHWSHGDGLVLRA